MSAQLRSPGPPPAPADWRASRFRRAQASAVALLGYPLVSALGRTLRWRVEGWPHFERAFTGGRRPVMVFWHGRILPATVYFRDRGIVVITSENFDGEWIARIIERFGYGTARGSTSRGARKALLQMVRAMRQGRPAGFTVDGPRGPARVVQPGAIWLAKATGNPLLPFHLEAGSSWTLNSWDRTQIPRPFSTVALAIGEPLDVPRDATAADLEIVRHDVHARLLRLEREAAAMLGRPPR